MGDCDVLGTFRVVGTARTGASAGRDRMSRSSAHAKPVARCMSLTTPRPAADAAERPAASDAAGSLRANGGHARA